MRLRRSELYSSQGSTREASRDSDRAATLHVAEPSHFANCLKARSADGDRVTPVCMRDTRVRPRVVLLRRDPPFLTQGIGPVVPRFGERWPVVAPVLGCNCGQDLTLEFCNCFGFGHG